jgi:alpha-N-acetylglucosamine transferase
MNKEKQRIAIAEACGYTVINDTLCHVTPDKDGLPQIAWIARLPDYLNDLNAMHEAMAHLEPEQVDQFAVELSGIVLENRKKYWWDLTSNEVGHVANATAAQRAEAFLRTVGKWEDDK